MGVIGRFRTQATISQPTMSKCGKWRKEEEAGSGRWALRQGAGRRQPLHNIQRTFPDTPLPSPAPPPLSLQARLSTLSASLLAQGVLLVTALQV